MKPRTKLHYEILKLHEKLPEITQKQIDWAYKKNFKFYAWKTKHKAVCFECGHAWQLERTLITTLFPIICPSCSRKLEQTDSHAWRKTECKYFQIFTFIGNFQVVRMFQMYHWMIKSTPARYSCHELYQHWIHADGKHNIMSTGFNGMGYFSQGGGWNWCGPMELRGNDNNRYYIDDAPVYPKQRIHKNIIRNGFTGKFYTFNEAYFFGKLLSDSAFEMFLKAGQVSLLKEFNHMSYRVAEFKDQIRICLKRKYIITDSANWFDYLHLLKHFHKNIYDPSLICPDNLKKAHDELVLEKRIIDENNRNREKEKRENDNIALKKAKKKLMHLQFTDGEITIFPLKNVMDFKNEEKILDHCVYSSEYHKKASSLILSARIGNERKETIEVSLIDFSIRQCRGFQNQDSEYHKQILKLMSSKLWEIKKAFNAPEKLKVKRKLKLVA